MNPYKSIIVANNTLNLKLSNEQAIFVTDIHNTLGDGIDNQLIRVENKKHEEYFDKLIEDFDYNQTYAKKSNDLIL